MLRGMLRSSVLLSAAAVKETKTQDVSQKETNALKPSELPIYTTIFAKDQPKPLATTAEPGVIRSSIEEGVKVVRETCCDCVKAAKDGKKPVDDFIATGIEHSKFAFDFLNQPANGIHRTGAIAVGAMSGYILAIRRGFFRRLLYTSVGGLGVASICYPKEAEVYSQQALDEMKTYATILYNFAYGVKPGDEPKPLPNLIPANMGDAYNQLKNYIFPDKK